MKDKWMDKWVDRLIHNGWLGGQTDKRAWMYGYMGMSNK